MTAGGSSSAPRWRAASMPSMPGMRTSSSTTSGSRLAHMGERFAAVGGLADDGDVVELLEQAAQPLARRRLVVDDQRAQLLRFRWEVGLRAMGRAGIVRWTGPRCHGPCAASAVDRVGGFDVAEREAQPDAVAARRLRRPRRADAAREGQFQPLPDVVERHAIARRGTARADPRAPGLATSSTISLPSDAGRAPSPCRPRAAARCRGRSRSRAAVAAAGSARSHAAAASPTSQRTCSRSPSRSCSMRW